MPSQSSALADYGHRPTGQRPYITEHPGGRVQVYDIKNAESFVRNLVMKSKLQLDHEETQDLIGAGLVILLDLAAKFHPHKPGYSKPGSFAGYCGKYLPNKIKGAWFAMHPEHLLITDPETGKRHWEFGVAPKSYDEITSRVTDEGSLAYKSMIDQDKVRHVGDFVQPAASQPLPA